MKPMLADRIEFAVEAAAKALHEICRRKPQFHWEQSSEEWRVDLRNFVRPIVEAAIEAADEFVAISIPKPKGPIVPP